jgi:two-component system cell cycle response regulator
MKILVAEDDRVSRLLMQRTLTKFGYEVVLAEDGRQAVEILSQHDAPRLALIDWMMPELDGPSLCREMRAQHRDTPYVYIILLTSKQSSEDVVAGLEAGADDYLTKPCQMAELRARLHTGHRILSLEDRLVKAREEMRYRATHDALTGIWNRASILSLVRSELQRGARELRPVSLLLCDVDHFKSVNDNYGHIIGDQILEEVAKRFKDEVRGYDAVGRYGGEEFLIVLSDCDTASLEVRAEALRRSIADSPLLIDDLVISITISIGGTTCGKAAVDLPLELILAEADTALYQAKARGRNRSVFASNGTSQATGPISISA